MNRIEATKTIAVRIKQKNKIKNNQMVLVDRNQLNVNTDSAIAL